MKKITVLLSVLLLALVAVVRQTEAQQPLPCVASAMFYKPNYANMKSDCVYSWDMHPNPLVTSGQVDWTPHAWSYSRYQAAGGDAKAAEIFNSPWWNGYILVGNECNVPTQCNMNPGWFATWLRNKVVAWKAIDPSVKVIIGNVIIHDYTTSGGETWLSNVRNIYINTYGLAAWQNDIAGMGFHVYPHLDPFNNQRIFVSQAINDMHYAITYTQQMSGANDEVWFTEVGCLVQTCNNGPGGTYPNWERDYASGIRAHLNNHPHGRVYWYTDWNEYETNNRPFTRAQLANGVLTDVGKAWRGDFLP
jgi:hypothetical protein